MMQWIVTVLCSVLSYSGAAWAQERPQTMVVIGVEIAFGRDSHDAMEQCVHKRQEGDNEWVPVGVNWIDQELNSFHSLFLCMHQQPKHVIPSEHSTVLQELMVFRHDCPPSMQLLIKPRQNVFICMKYTNAKDALATGRYIIDISTSLEQQYNHQHDDGWNTWPWSVHVDPLLLYDDQELLFAAHSALLEMPVFTKITERMTQHIKTMMQQKQESDHVFLSVRRPIRPISGVNWIKEVEKGNVYTACEAIEPMGSWRPSAFASLLNREDETALLCLQRSDLSSNKRILVHVSRTLEDCQDTESIPSVCLHWGPLENANDESFVTDLAIYPLSINQPPWTTLPLADSSNVLAIRKSTSSLKRRALQSSTSSIRHRPPLRGTPTFDPITNETTGLSFRILQIADLHYTGDPYQECMTYAHPPDHDEMLRGRRLFQDDCTEAWTTDFVELLLEIEQPDFVVFTGDNVHVHDPALKQAAMDVYSQAVEARGIPWTMIFGNHDENAVFTKQEMLEIVQNKAYSYVESGPSDVDGVGNFALHVHAPVTGPWGSVDSKVFRMYFLDSHADLDPSNRPVRGLRRLSAGYEWIQPSQIAYYKTLAAESDVPAIMFFHIPIPEYALASRSTARGGQQEKVSAPHVNSGLFGALIEMNDVKATFAGHDHVNDYCYKRQGIQLCYGGGIGFGFAYGSMEFDRRARVIEWQLDVNQQHSIRTWKRHFQDPIRIHEQETLYQQAP